MGKYTLYYHPYSICSLQVLYTLAIATANSSDRDPLLEVERRIVDIFNDAQLEETFLTRVNPKGQVPVLTSSTISPIADSLLITKHLIEKWPCLGSSQHHFLEYLEEIHALNYFALSFPDRPQVAGQLVNSVEARLAWSDISASYREALAHKLAITIEEKFQGVRLENVRINEERARRLFLKLDSILHGTPWLFGSRAPTALDAHAVILIGRLKDVGRTALIPERLLAYADAAFETPVLQNVMEGRRTMMKMSA